MPYLDISLIKSSCLTMREKELYAWYFNELSAGYYSSAAGSRQERLACQWMQELTMHFWADVERTMSTARARLSDNLALMMGAQCCVESEEREEEKRKLREVHEAFAGSVEGSKVARGKYSADALGASHWGL